MAAVHRTELKDIWETWRDGLLDPAGTGTLDANQFSHQKLASAALFVTRGEASALAAELEAAALQKREAALGADKAALQQHARGLEQGLQQLGIQPGGLSSGHTAGGDDPAPTHPMEMAWRGPRAHPSFSPPP